MTAPTPSLGSNGSGEGDSTYFTGERPSPHHLSVLSKFQRETKQRKNKTIKYLLKIKPRPHLWNLIVEGLWHFSPPPIFAAPLPSGGVLTVNITTIFTALNDLSLSCLQFEKWFNSSVMIPVLADTFSYPKPWCSHKRNKEAKRQVMNIWQI